MDFAPEDINSGEAEKGREDGEWRDNTTQVNRYEDFIYALDEVADLDGVEELDHLDVGCATGEATGFFRDVFEEKYGMDMNTVGVDISQQALDEAEKNDRVDRGVNVRAQELTSEFGENSFDIVTSKTLLPRLEASDQGEALREIESVVDPEGYAVLQLDPQGGDGVSTGVGYILEGEELTELRRETDGFDGESYPIDSMLEHRKVVEYHPESEASYEGGGDTGYLSGMREELESAGEKGQGDDSDIIVGS